MTNKLKDKLHLLKSIIDNREEIDLSKEATNCLINIFNYYKPLTINEKLDKKDEQRLNKLFDVINSFDSFQITQTSRKLLENATSIHTR
jgi:isopropylmalate/homocitrate/citramalate synthase